VAGDVDDVGEVVTVVWRDGDSDARLDIVIARVLLDPLRELLQVYGAFDVRDDDELITAEPRQEIIGACPTPDRAIAIKTRNGETTRFCARLSPRLGEKHPSEIPQSRMGAKQPACR
jgi:hypothetical protein